ncbi:MAG: hypothetical protein D6752_07325, partial [Candidatus Nitrosothermus koennekii]
IEGRIIFTNFSKGEKAGSLDLESILGETDEDKAIERASKTIAFYTAVGDIYAEFLREHGYREEVDSIREEYARNGFTNIHKYVSKKMLDSLAIYGNKDQCNKMFKRFASMNITPVLHLNPVYDAEQSMKDLLEAIV